MGKASSSKKVARAAKAAGRPGAKKSYAWPAALGAVVIVGVLLVVLSFGGSSDAISPRVGEHWHAAYGVYQCDKFLAPFTDKGEDQFGIHTHGEGLMHIHPFTSRTTGTRANLGAFFDDVGAKVSDTSIESEPLGIDVKNGDKCGSKPAHVELWEWQNPGDKAPKVVTKDIKKFNPQNDQVWVLAFVPDGTEPVLPSSSANLQDPKALEEGRQPVTDSSSTTVPSGDTTPTTAATTTIPPTDASTTTAP